MVRRGCCRDPATVPGVGHDGKRLRLAVLAGGKAEQHRWMQEARPGAVFDCRVCQRLRIDETRACLLDRELVGVTGWGVLSRREIVAVASSSKPWDWIFGLRDRRGRPVCPIPLVEDEEREWVALETDASEYGRPVDWDERVEAIFRVIRGAKAETQNMIRETLKKQQRTNG